MRNQLNLSDLSLTMKGKDWKQKIKNMCPCFVEKLSKATPCYYQCDLEELKTLLLQHETPDRKSLVQAMVLAGVFTKREIVYALIEIYDSIYLSCERRVEEAIGELKKNYRIIIDDNNILKAWEK